MLVKMKPRRNTLFLSSTRSVKMNPSPSSHHMYFKTILALCSHLRLIRARGLFVSSFPAKSFYLLLYSFSRTLHAKPISTLSAEHHTHFRVWLCITIVLGVVENSWDGQRCARSDNAAASPSYGSYVNPCRRLCTSLNLLQLLRDYRERLKWSCVCEVRYENGHGKSLSNVVPSNFV